MLIEFRDLGDKIRDVARDLGPRRPVVLETERSLTSVIRFLALLDEGFTVFPVPGWTFRDADFRAGLLKDSGTAFSYWALGEEKCSHEEKGPVRPELSSGNARFIVRTSGSSGKSKLVLHDPKLFSEKYMRIGPHFEKTLLFSPADSIAGIETILETRFHKKSLGLVGDKITPAAVIKAIEEFSIDYFQTTPSFLNLMMIAGKFKAPPPVSLKKIAFGSEPPQEKVLREMRENWSDVTLIQTYGMSEIGIQRTFPATDPVTFIPDDKLNPVRIRNGVLEVKSMTPLLCYLNAEAQFTEDGWFLTHDEAQFSDGAYRVTGRAGDLINVAGRKFFPSELEALLLRVPEVLDATVKVVPEEFLGTAVVAEIVAGEGTDEASLRLILKKYLETSVPSHMHPRKITIRPPQETERFKKIRRAP